MTELALTVVRGSSLPTLSESIAGCNFQSVHPDINEQNFPTCGNPVADLKDMLTVSQKGLGGEKMTPAEMEAAIDAKGFRSATLVEILVYAKKKWNGRDWVAALGSIWVDADGYRHAPLLCKGDHGRKLNLGWDGTIFRWLGVDRFLVVRMKSLAHLN